MPKACADTPYLHTDCTRLLALHTFCTQDAHDKPTNCLAAHVLPSPCTRRTLGLLPVVEKACLGLILSPHRPPHIPGNAGFYPRNKTSGT